MDLRNNPSEDNLNEETVIVSVLQGDGFGIRKILSRASSVGQSSRIYYRSAEGIPFKWESQPGTPKTPQEDNFVPPPSPSPLMQSMGLPLPNVDHDKPQGSSLKTLKIWSLKEILKKPINLEVTKVEALGRKSKHKEKLSSNGELLTSVKDLSVSSVSTSSVSESSFSSNSRVLDSSVIDGPFCCSPWDVPAILVEGNTRIYYCSHHMTTFAIEEDGSFLTRILSRFPSDGDQFPDPFYDEIAPAGVPFKWEMQPGTPKRPAGNEIMIIPPPSPPPAAQSLALQRPQRGKNKKSVWRRAWNWMRDNNKMKERSKTENEFSFRYHGSMEIGGSFKEEFKGSVPEKMVKRSLARSCFNFGSWSKRDVLVFTGRKSKSLT